tara:strand:- start:953 stop:1105 length:153 start_codon:yes stop_codon:yes gene_type:complete
MKIKTKTHIRRKKCVITKNVNVKIVLVNHVNVQQKINVDVNNLEKYWIYL